MVWTVVYLSGVSSWATVIVPSPQEANTNWVAGSKRVASTPFPIGQVATTLPLEISTASSTPLRQPVKTRLCAKSIDSPVGVLQGSRGQVFMTLRVLESNSVSLGLVFDVDEDVAHAVRLGSFRLVGKRDVADDLSRLGVDRRRVGARLVVKRKDTLRSRVVEDAVGGSIRQFDVTDDFESIGIEDGYRLCVSVRRERALELQEQNRCHGCLPDP